MITKFNKDAFIEDILTGLHRNSEWGPFLARADAFTPTRTGYKAIYKRVGTMGVGDYYNSGSNTYRVSNKDGETNSYVQNIEIDVNIRKSSEMYYSAVEYAGFEDPNEIFIKQQAKQERDWTRMHDIEVLTLITKGGEGQGEKATVIPVDVSELKDGKTLRKYISSECLKIKRKGLITEDNEHVGINSSDIVCAIAPQQFDILIEDYALIDSSIVELREDMRATKINGILVYENLYLDSEIKGDTSNTWMVVSVKKRIALPTAIQSTYDDPVYKGDHIVGLYGVMGKGILDGSLVTRFQNAPGIKPELANESKNNETENLKKQLEETRIEIIKIQENNNLVIKQYDETIKALKDELTNQKNDTEKIKSEFQKLKKQTKEETTAK